MKSSLFVVNVRLPDEYKPLIEDVVKTTVLLLSIHILQHLTRNHATPATGLFNVNFWKLVLFVVIGFCAYYLVIKKLVQFRYLGENDVEDPSISINSLSVSPFDGIARLRKWLKDML